MIHKNERKKSEQLAFVLFGQYIYVLGELHFRQRFTDSVLEMCQAFREELYILMMYTGTRARARVCVCGYDQYLLPNLRAAPSITKRTWRLRSTSV